MVGTIVKLLSRGASFLAMLGCPIELAPILLCAKSSTTPVVAGQRKGFGVTCGLPASLRVICAL